MCRPEDYAHLLEYEPTREEREAMAAAQAADQAPRPRDVSGPPRFYRCSTRLPLLGQCPLPEGHAGQCVGDSRPALLVAADALGLPDCGPGCTCRGQQ